MSQFQQGQDYADILMDDMSARQPLLSGGEYSESLLDNVSSDKTDADRISALFEEQRGILVDTDSPNARLITSLLENEGVRELFESEVLEFGREATKSLMRGLVNAVANPVESNAAVLRMIRTELAEPAVEAAFGEKGVEVLRSADFVGRSFDFVSEKVRENINAQTRGSGFLAPKPQDRIFAWDDPDWWASQSGEALVFLVATVLTGQAAGASAIKAGLSAKWVNRVRLGAAANTTLLIESQASRTDFMEALMERGLTKEEASLFADRGAAAVGLVNGILDIFSLNRFLTGSSLGRHAIISRLLDVTVETVTEPVQELVIFGTENILGIAEEGTIKERLKAAAALGAAVSTPVSIVTGRPRAETPETAREQRAAERREPVRGEIVEADVPSDARREVLARGRPFTEDEQGVIATSEQDSPSDIRKELLALNEEERAIASAQFEDAIEANQNPVTGEVLSEDERISVMEMMEELENIQQNIPEDPDETFANKPLPDALLIQEPPDGRTQEQPDAPAPVTTEAQGQEARQEAEEDAQKAVATLEAEQEPEAAEPSEARLEPLEDVETTEDSLGRVAQAFPEVADAAAQLNTLNQQLSDAIDEGNLGDARKLSEEAKPLIAEQLDTIDELIQRHGAANGQFEKAAAETRAIGDTPQASVQRLVNNERAVGDENFSARVVPAELDTEQGELELAAGRIGLKITFFEATGGVAAAHDPYGDGRRILLNTNLTTEEALAAIFSHEVAHVFRKASPSAWEKLNSIIFNVDEDGLRKVGREYWDRLTAGKTTSEAEFEQWFNSDFGRSESVSAYIESRALETDFYNRVLQDKTMLQMVRDVARRLINALGLTSLDTAVLIEIEKLADAAHTAFVEPVAAPVPTDEAGRIAFARELTPKQQAERDAGVTKNKINAQEAKDLRKKLRDQKKLGEQAFREGIDVAAGKVKNALENVFGKMGMDVTQRQIERMQKARKARTAERVFREGIKIVEDRTRLIKAKMVSDARSKRANIQFVKKQVVDVVRKNLTGKRGTAMQGRFLGDVQRAETLTNMHKAMTKIEVAIGELRFTESIDDLKKAARKAKKFPRMTNDLKDQIATVVEQASLLAFDTRTNAKGVVSRRQKTFSTQQEYDAATDSVLDAVNAIEQMLALRKFEVETFQADKARTLQGHLGQVENNILGTPSATTPGVRIGGKKDLKGQSKMVQDKVTGFFRARSVDVMDVSNLSRWVEGRWDGKGVLTNLLDDEMKLAEEQYDTERRDETDKLDAMVRENTSYRNLAEAQMRMTGTLGEANQQFADVTIAGEQVTLSLDIIGEMVAVDNRTMLGIVESGFKPEGARQTAALRPTLDEFLAIRAEWATKFGTLVGAMKANIEVNFKPRTFKVAKELKGREPEAEPPGWWMSKRDIEDTPEFGLSQDFRSFMRSATKRFLENAGFLEKRTGGTTPFVLGGLLKTYLDHTDHSLKIIHLAIPVRNAAAVLLNPRTVQAINRTSGAEVNEVLQKHLIEAARLNQDTDGGPDRRIRWLNTNMIATFLITNVGTFMRQIGGVFRLPAVMPMKWFLVGIKNLKPGTWKEMKANSGFNWNRYEGDSMGRWSPMRGQGLEGMDFSGFRQSFGALMKSAVKRDRKGASKSWNAFIRNIKLLDWMDAIVARISWEGRKAQVASESPSFGPQQIMKETARLQSTDIRRTQNTSSPNDSASLAVKWRNNPLRYFLLFSTDPNKSLNLLIRSWAESPAQGAKASAGVAANMLWSAYVVNIGLQYGGDIVASMLGAALGIEPDEIEREKQRIRSWEKAHIRMVSEVLGLHFFGEEIVTAVQAVSQPFRRDSVLRAPIAEVIADTVISSAVIGVSGYEKIYGAVAGASEEDQQKFTEDMIDGLKELTKSGTTLLGNPALMPWYRIKPIKEQLFPGDEDIDEGGALSPEVR